MINTSTEYQQALSDKKRFVARASCLLKDGTVLDFDKTNLMAGGVKIADGVSGTSKFEVGTAIINQLTIMVFNGEEMFSDYDFTDAVITVWVGMPLSDRIEWLKKGVFIASDPTTTPGVITIKALDNMSKFDAVYDGGIGFPATLQSIVQYCCTQCGVLLVNGEFPNFRYQISKNPFTGTTNITYRAIIAYCALLAGCYARCNADGRLELKWYDTKAFDDIIDGGVFDETTAASYQTGVDLDGGNFVDYSSGDTADGGTFTDVLPYHHIYSFSSLSVSTEDVVITGIRVTAADSEDSAGKKIEGETYLCGAEGYVLDVSGNPLIESGKAKEVAEYLAGRVVGMRFRPFTASAIGDPSWEAGDAAIVTDRKGNSYHTYLTNITYSTGGYASISCDAEPAARHSADRYAEINKVIADIKKDNQQKLTEYGKLLEQMNGLAINAMGYYETTAKQDDGSDISYMHDKPVLAESKIVYKKSVDGVFWTNDYQGTDQATTAAGKWKSGIDKDGNAVLNVIAAIGISFDWAHGGTLTLGGKDNGDGLLELLDANGNVIGRLDCTGANLSGNIKMVCEGYTSKGTITTSVGSFEYDDKSGVLVIAGKQTGYGLEIASKDNTYDETLMIMPSAGAIVNGKKSSAILSTGKLAIASDINDADTYSSVRLDGNVSIGQKISGTSHTLAMKDTGITVNYGNSNGGQTILLIHGSVDPTGSSATFKGYLTCTGGKSRLVETDSYGNRLLYCYEMTSPIFGDIGEGITDENGECLISIDDIFSETARTNIEYQVFLQKEGRGDIWIEEKTPFYFLVKGTPKLKFAWEIKCKQTGFETERLDDYYRREDALDDHERDYNEVASVCGGVNDYIKEQEDVLYEAVK